MMAVLLVLILVGWPDGQAFSQQTDTTTATQQQETGPRGVTLEQNYPNPFRRDTRIPFVLGADMFEDGRPVVVTVRIYNVLHKQIAFPTALDHPTGTGRPARELRYERPGRYLLYWDGTDDSGRRVNSGIYFCQITAGRSQDVIRIVVSN
jgi:hypothetical protein